MAYDFNQFGKQLNSMHIGVLPISLNSTKIHHLCMQAMTGTPLRKGEWNKVHPRPAMQGHLFASKEERSK